MNQPTGNTLLAPEARGLAVDIKVIGLMGLVGMLCPASFAQSTPATLAIDPFIGAVETMKRSVASVDCLVANGAEARITVRTGSAFLISDAGDFLTAAHVIRDMQKGERPCPISAITIPVDNWHPEARNEDLLSLPFKTSDCRIDSDSDVAACRLNEESVRRRLTSKVVPVKFEWSIPPDGTQVAFTGFPLSARDPMTVRTGVAAYRTVWLKEKVISDLVLDRAGWPGSSGSPVYLSDGTVVAILIGSGKEEATGLTVARPSLLIREMLTGKPKK